MPRNVAKHRCERPGCRAWAVRGLRHCAVHRREPVGLASQRCLETLSMATERAARAVLDDECLIAEELQGLGLLRAYALACLREGHCGVEHQEEAQPARERTQTLSPAQFIRVWTDTAARVVQLLRVRRQPAGHGGLSEVLDQATDYVQARLPFPWPDDTQA